MDITRWFKIEERKYEKSSRICDRVETESVPKVEPLIEVLKEINKLDLRYFSEISLNPRMEYIYKLSDVEIRDKINDDLNYIINRVNKYARKQLDYRGEPIQPVIYMISEHGAEALHKFHFHGLIANVGNDIKDYFTRLARRRIGRFQITYIKYPDSYLTYMFKSHITNKTEIWGRHSYIKINTNVDYKKISLKKMTIIEYLRVNGCETKEDNENKEQMKELDEDTMLSTVNVRRCERPLYPYPEEEDE